MRFLQLILANIVCVQYFYQYTESRNDKLTSSVKAVFTLSLIPELLTNTQVLASFSTNFGSL